MTVTKPFSSSLVCTQTANLALGLSKLHVICAGQIGAWNRVHTIVNSCLPLETLALTYELVLSTFFTLIGNINYKMNFILNQTQPLERQYCIYSQSKTNGKHTCKHIHSKYTDKQREFIHQLQREHHWERSGSTLDEQQSRGHTVKTERGTRMTQRKMRIKSKEIDQGMTRVERKGLVQKCYTLVVADAVLLSIAV